MQVLGDLELGGRYQVEGNAGGEIQTCEPPRLFAVTWEFMGATSWLAVELTEVAEGTRLELRHTQHTDNDFWTQFGPGATGVGWDLGLLGLGHHLAGAKDVDPAQAEAWSLSEEGRAFSTGCADGWAQADIAAMARRYHHDDLATAERKIRDFEQQQRISFRIRARAVHQHLD